MKITTASIYKKKSSNLVLLIENGKCIENHIELSRV